MMKKAVFMLGCCFLLMGVHQARAGVIFSLGNNPQQPSEENILFNMGMSGATVTGVTDQTGTTVDFSSTTDTLISTANGQAMVSAQDGAINNISISVPGNTYQDLIFNPFLGSVASGSATVTVTTNTGIETFSYPGGLGNGNNFLTITTDSGTLIESTTIAAATGFADLKQPRISGIASSGGPGPSGAPEPGTVFMLSGGMLALLGLVRLQKRANS